METTAHETSRRAVLAAGAALATVAGPARSASPNDRLHREADAIKAMVDSYNADDATTPHQWTAWKERESAFIREVEALPATPANAPIKARAVSLIYDDGLEDLFEQDTTDSRPVLQIIRALEGRA